MYRFLLVLIPAALFAGYPRYARLGEMEGKVEVQLHAADPWLPAERNLPLTESAWLRTSAASRLEIELDDGSVLRLGPDSLIELSDYTRLSTGQRVTVLSLDRGVAWFTGEPEGKDSLSLAVPGAQITLLRGARVRLEALDAESRLSVIEGAVRLSCASAELDIREGQTAAIQPANNARFSLDRQLTPMELDKWSEERDKLLAAPASGGHVNLRYGLADLDAAGQWISTDAGTVWKPKTGEGWAPFQKGRWRWYDELGYTWVGGEEWGWLPYHYGRWMRKGELGWVWTPPSRPVFKPGDVYWLYGRQFAGWGPLAPGEDWTPSAAPRQFLNVNTTYASFPAGARVIDPAGFTARPAEPLGSAVFALALPSPPLPASRLEAVRPALRVGATRPVTPVVPGAEFQSAAVIPPAPEPPPPPPAVVTNPASDAPPVVQPGDPGAPPDPGYPPPPVVYPVPVYTGIVVINPPEHPNYSRRNPNQQPAPPARGQSPGPGSRPSGPVPVVSQPGAGSGPPAGPSPAPGPIHIERPNPPRIGIPGPAPTDRPRIEAPPPRRDGPREQPRESKPAPAAQPSAPSTPSKPAAPPKSEQKNDNDSRRK